MTGGYTGKILYVQLSTGEIRVETPQEGIYRDFIGGYGIGARLLFNWQKPGIDALGPENHLGFITGPLTGTSLFSPRYTVVGKSPLTSTWGDANSGGDFGPRLKAAGYDAVFLTGVAENPVYLFISEAGGQLRDARHIWGKDTAETEDWLKAELGKQVSVACIGPAGERLSLISCVINAKGRAAARSGLGAVMGVKKLKAVVVAGSQDVPLADRELVGQLRRQWVKVLRDDPRMARFRKFGTSANLANNVAIGDAPVKNWGGVPDTDYPPPLAKAATFDEEKTARYVDRPYACLGCPLACGGHLKAGTGLYQYAAGSHRPEYESMAAFGSLCLNRDLESIIMANDLCNRYGLDTISAGATIAFAIECYENGYITIEDTDGIELNWGNHEAIIAMLHRLARREGFGHILADGVRRAAERLGPGVGEYAIHVQGQEVGMHDPRLRPGWATSYQMDATPGRHTQGGAHLVEGRGGSHGIEVKPTQPYIYTGKGDAQRKMSAYNHVLNAIGFCLFNSMLLDIDFMAQCLKAVVGWDYSVAELLETGDRISTMRMAFNVREGLNPVQFPVPGRVIGRPPLPAGPTARVSVDLDTQVREYLAEMGWDPSTGKPGESTLRELGLQDVAQALGPG